MIKLVQILLGLAFYFGKYLTQKQLADAEANGQDIGLIKAFLMFSQELDERVKAATTAGDDVASGRVSVGSANDPFNRARDKDNFPDGKDPS